MVTQESIINEATNIAFDAMRNFLNNMSLKREEYDYLYKINISCEDIYTPLEDCMYIKSENKIIIGKKYINKLIELIKKGQISEKIIILDVAANIVHEMIHASRTVVELNSKEAKLISEYYELPDGLTEEEIDNQRYMQGNFEEIITDSLSDIIIKSRYEKEFDLKEMADYIEERSKDEGIRIGAKILGKVGENKIREFMEEVYQQEPSNPFKEYFKENYDDLLYYVSEIYVAMYCQEKIDKEILKEAKKIIVK